jgi:hypothetical protein
MRDSSALPHRWQADRHEIDLRQKTHFVSRFKQIILVQPYQQKYFYFFFSEIMITFAPSRLDQRGASRSSRTLRRDAVGVSMLQRGFHADEQHRCARSSRVVLASRR